jgi:hypothetical protein
LADQDPRPSGKLKYDSSVIGQSGLNTLGGYVADELNPALRGQLGAKTYRNMADNDATVGAILFTVSMLIRSATWAVQAVDDSDEAAKVKDFVEECLADMSVAMTAVVSEIATMFTYGFAPLEIVWKRRQGPTQLDGSKRSTFSDGKIGIRNLSLRSQPTIFKWDFDPDSGSILGAWQQPQSGPPVLIPITRLLLFRTVEERNNPEGRSMLRTAYRSWYFKRRIEEIEAIGIERDLAGLPIALIPGQHFAIDGTDDDKRMVSKWDSIVKNIRQDQMAGITMPSDRDGSGNLLYELKLLTSGGARAFDTSGVIDRYNKAIATSVLADFLFLGQGRTGSFALSSDKTALFATAIGAYTASIGEVFTRHLFPRLLELNGMDPTLCPSLSAGNLQHENLQEVGDFVVKLVQAGAQLFPDRELENKLRKMAGLPEAPEDGGLLPDQGVPGLPGDTSPGGSAPPPGTRPQQGQPGGGAQAAAPAQARQPAAA